MERKIERSRKRGERSDRKRAGEQLARTAHSWAARRRRARHACTVSSPARRHVSSPACRRRQAVPAARSAQAATRGAPDSVADQRHRRVSKSARCAACRAHCSPRGLAAVKHRDRIHRRPVMLCAATVAPASHEHDAFIARASERGSGTRTRLTRGPRPGERAGRNRAGRHGRAQGSELGPGQPPMGPLGTSCTARTAVEHCRAPYTMLWDGTRLQIPHDLCPMAARTQRRK